MAIIYDFKTGLPISRDRAVLEIIGADGAISDTGLVLVDGVMPLNVALALLKLCDQHNARAAK